MKTYHKNGIVSNIDYVLTNEDSFVVQCDTVEQHNILYYTRDNLVRELDSELIALYDTFRNQYFSNTDTYYKNLDIIPMGLYIGGQSSEIAISKEQFLQLKNTVSPYLKDIAKHIYVSDCQYLVSTVQNLIQAIEFCFVQYYIQISKIELPTELPTNDNSFLLTSEESMQLMFFVETFFTKMYSILDIMVKIVYELENPRVNFPSITKLTSSEKLWGDKKHIKMNRLPNSIFEDCESIRKIEALRNEAVHNGTWEFRPRVFLQVDNKTIIERYTLAPDFENGRLSAVKNRRHFFSTGTKINDMLVSIHNEFYERLIVTLKYINTHF